MPKAAWNGKAIAETKKYEVVEGNAYFPPDSVKKEFLRESSTPYTCPWKGKCQYFDIVVNGKVNKDAAWSYPEPKPAAKNIKGYVAFWNGVEVTE